MPSAMKLANSVSVPLPRMIAPACRSLLAMKASFSGLEPPRATEPAVVGMSLVAMLSLRITGIPKSGRAPSSSPRSEEHTSELQSRLHLVCRLLLEKKKNHDDAPPHPAIEAGASLE